MANDFGELVAQAALRRYRNLPRTGKPQGREMTSMAAFLISRDTNPELEVVAVGTGTKCVGRSQLNENGAIVSDGHAEVVARRALLRWLYAQLESMTTGTQLPNDAIAQASIFEWMQSEGQPKRICRLRKGVQLHLYCSQPPCETTFTYATSRFILPPTCFDCLQTHFVTQVSCDRW